MGLDVEGHQCTGLNASYVRFIELNLQLDSLEIGRYEKQPGRLQRCRNRLSDLDVPRDHDAVDG